jgi:hypothetical protein
VTGAGVTGHVNRAAHHLGDLCQPVPIAAAVLLGINDHLLKGADLLPGAVTGKLSDVAGLLLFPILLCALVRAAATLVGRELSRRAVAGLAALATAAGFAAVKLSPGFNTLVERLWGHNVMDAGDLWALPMVAVAWLWLLERERAGRSLRAPGWVRATALLGMLAVCAATPAPRYPRNFPRWVVTGDGARQLACGPAQAWVSKSGKTGVGLSIEAPGCELRIDSATLIIDDTRVPGRALTDDRGRPYLAFEFDNEALWNQGRRTGRFDLRLHTGGAAVEWQVKAEHRLDGFHRERHQRDDGWHGGGR